MTAAVTPIPTCQLNCALAVAACFRSRFSALASFARSFFPGILSPQGATERRGAAPPPPPTGQGNRAQPVINGRALL